jgi:inorganic pyrophosphatase
MPPLHLWHEVEPGPDAPETINVIVEIPRGSRNKYEYDKKVGAIKLDRVLSASVFYPGDYGFIPQTFYDDDDPLDVLVVINTPTFPGCVLQARPIGIFHLVDRGEPDDKILAVPQFDPFFADIREYTELPAHFLKEVTHFFKVYKDLEGVTTEARGWEGADVAKERIRHAINLYWDMRAGRLGKGKE